MNRIVSRWDGETLQALKERWDRPHLHIYSEVDSTNERARELAEGNAPAGTIVLADMQVQGKGLAGRRWHSPKGGGLYLSLILRPAMLPNPTLLPLLAGLGIARAVRRLVPKAEVAMKWPNDLIVNDRKAGGALSEASFQGERPNYVVLGVGINVNHQPEDFPPELRAVAISLAEAAGDTISRLALADLVLGEIEERCAQPPENLDSEQLREFDEYDWLRDRRCSVESTRDGARQHGAAVGIAPDGALLFRPDKGALRRVTTERIVAEELPLPDF